MAVIRGEKAPVMCGQCRYFELTHGVIRSGNCHALPQVVRVVNTYWCGMGKEKK